MAFSETSNRIVIVGDHGGLGSIYMKSGDLILQRGEEIIRSIENWDIDVISPWRRVLPKTVFPGFRGMARSRLYVTSRRIVLIREIDEWRELAGELTPLGLPNAAAKESQLAALKRAGIRQFCQILPQSLTMIACRKYVKRGSMLDMKLMGDDNRQYGIMIWKTDGSDPQALALIQSRFRPGATGKAPLEK